MNSIKHSSSIDGVIFDMDGTLIQPLLDFVAIRRDLNIDGEIGILEAMALMPPAERDLAHRRLLEHELHAAHHAHIMPGAAEIIAACRTAGLKLALLTRNTRQAAEIVLERFGALRFDLTRCREDGVIKPEPDGVLYACEQLAISPSRTVCVGDFEYDIIAANAAGAISVLLATGDIPGWAASADHVIRHLDELRTILHLEPQ